MKYLRSFQNSDLALGVFVLAIVAMLLVPLMPWMIDVLISVNLAVSLLLLLIGLFMPNALSLLAFPSLLLLTTLFRLSLNVASCRLILSQAYAGAVIEAFGRFLIRGEVVVGMIIFAIITIVNLIVISRGAARISEVAARFALDSLPGKQIAIDADMKSGLLTAEEAQNKREDLRKEYQLYAAMDGAMKFVQGDAIAGIFIIFTNIFGGIYVGISQGLAFSDAVSTYTVLTVGDGLVTQIPALLVAVCAGLVVTRVSSGDKSTLSSDLVAQLSSQPRSWIVTGIIIFAMGLLPGIPMIYFTLVAIAFVLTGFLISKRSAEFQIAKATGIGGEFKDPALLFDGYQERETSTDSLILTLDSKGLYPLYTGSREDIAVEWQAFRNEFLAQYGVSLPPIRIVASDNLSTNSYQISWGRSVFDQGEIPQKAVVIEMQPAAVPSVGGKLLAEVTSPLSQSKISWVSDSKLLQETLEKGGIRSYSAISFLLLKIVAFFKRHPEEIFTITDVHQQLKSIEKNHPGFLADTFQKESLDISKVTELSHELIKEGIGVSDFRRVIEAVALYYSSHKALIGEGEEIEIFHLVSFVRMQWRRRILASCLNGSEALKVFSLSSAVEEIFEQTPLDSTAVVLPIAPDSLDSLLSGYQLTILPTMHYGCVPLAVLCKAEVRAKVSLFFRSLGSEIVVFSYDELDSSIELEQAGVWNI